MPKGNEDLKAKIAKIQQKGKTPVMPVPEVLEDAPAPEETEEPTMEALEAEFEAKKKALMQKKVVQEEPAQSDESGLDQAIQEYSDEGKFRVELVFQLVQLNKSMKDIADALKNFAQNE